MISKTITFKKKNQISELERMVLIIITGWIPYGKEKELGQRYIESVKKFPLDRSLEKNIVQVAVKPTKDGWKTISITEPKPGKYEEMVNRLNQQMLMFTSIEGYKYKMETFTSGVDAMPLVGLELPKL